MSQLMTRIDELIRGLADMRPGEAFHAVEEVFGQIKAQETLSADELTRFFGFVELVLYEKARHRTVRISGIRQANNPKDVSLEFGETFEVALHRVMAFLARNFADHLDEYDAHGYCMAVLRAFAKEYADERTMEFRSASLDAPARDDSGEDSDRAWRPEPSAEPPPAWLERYERIRELKPDGEIFYDWFVGTLSRQELARLHGLTLVEVDAAILHACREFEHGQLLPLVQWLVGQAEDGDIFLLATKGLSGEQIGEKVGKTNWTVYKRLNNVRRRAEQLRGQPEFRRLLAVAG